MTEGPQATIARHSILKRNRFSRNQLIVFAALFAIIGGYLLIKSFAATPTVASIEGENMLPTTTTTSSGTSANLALNRPVTATSLETANFPASYAVDGNSTTRWSSKYSDPQSLQVDLGSVQTISRVVLKWEVAYGKAYQIQTSNDGSTWTNIYSTSTGDGATDDLTVAGSGRYVRMYGTARGTVYGYSLYEMQVYGPSSTTTSTTPSTYTSVVSDSAASGGKDMELTGNGTINGSFNLPSTAVSMAVVAKSNLCNGTGAAMTVKVDGNQLISATVNNTSLSAFNASTNLAAGTHSLAISYTNDTSVSGCDRNLYVDVTTFYGPATINPAPTVTLSGSPSTVSAGSASTLTWNSTNDTSCTASGAWSGSVGLSGSKSTGALNQTSTYTLTCVNASTNQSATASTTVTVTQPAPPPPPSSTIPNNLGVMGQAAPSWTDSTKWRSDSSSLISSLVSADTGGSELAVAGYGIAFVKATSSDPLVTVTNKNGWGTNPGTTSLRVPNGALPAAGSDAHLAVEQPDGSVVDMWQAAKSGSNWTAGAVAVAKPGQYYYTVAGCRGSSLSLASGVITPQEVKAGVINHVLAASLPASVVSRSYVFPSYSSDGSLSGGIPEGARLVLDPSYDISGLTGLKKIVAQALKTYGMMNVDRTGSDVEIDAQSPESWTAFGQPDPWAAQGISGYPDLGITSLLSHMKVAIGN